MAKIRFPKNIGGASVAGRDITPDKKGFVEVTAEEAQELLAHGAVIVEEDEKKDDEQQAQ